MKILSFSCFFFISMCCNANTLILNYYGTFVELNYDESIIDWRCIKLKANNYSLNQFYDLYKEEKYSILLKSFQRQKDVLNLNDWMYYKLIVKTVNELYPKSKQLYKEVVVWFFLFESGYDIKTLFDKNNVYLYAPINSFFENDEESVCADVLIKGTKKFTILNILKKPSELLYFGTKENKEGKLFLIEAKSLPNLTPQVIKKKEKFYSGEEKYEIEYEIDTTLISIYRDAPSGCLGESFEVPLSKVTYNSLIPQLKELIKDKNNVEAGRIILSFVRETFKHKDDKIIYGREKFMTPEEALYYEYSDCEDRSALFYYLIKELLNIPIVLLDYSSHCSIATSFDSLEIKTKKSFDYNGKSYWFTEPTDFYNTIEIGSTYDYMKDDEFKIIKEYKPIDK